MFDLNKSINSVPKIDGVISEEYLTVEAASQITGYNGQYIRRLLRSGKLIGVRAGQTWLILFDSLVQYLDTIRLISDRRWGSRKPQTPPQ
jgi:excisionase family DNA binding protein